MTTSKKEQPNPPLELKPAERLSQQEIEQALEEGERGRRALEKVFAKMHTPTGEEAKTKAR